ncbi:unnamed protein product [Didymodactylos carnosus]|uniref:Uncharacterized protein n=1 Tax=Didymodactylos carnosus TaxID=1234261 RepID=A0A813QEJ2_9BILA|nr:unnamed protein product [Didymodactylos carnosus]CAF3548224.1 unnamed protein product [Didymodactylos carnosus]
MFSENHRNSSTSITTRFPVAVYFDLKEKFICDQSSISVKPDEALSECLLSATILAKEGIINQDRHCTYFINSLVPQIFHHLLTTDPYRNPGGEVAKNIFNILEILIDLIAARLSYFPVPVNLLECLTLAFSYDTLFQRKHVMQPYEKSKDLDDKYILTFPAVPFSTSRPGQNGWLCSLIDRFVKKNGVINLKTQFNNGNLTTREYTALLSPFTNCLEYVISDKYRQLFALHFEQALEHIKGLVKADLEIKSTKAVFALFGTLRKVASQLLKDRLETIEELQLNFTLKMIHSSNSKAKMASLKDVSE